MLAVVAAAGFPAPAHGRGPFPAVLFNHGSGIIIAFDLQP
jgi:hypothetical protein